MNRFFVEGRRAVGEAVVFDGSDAHKMLAVLRLREGDVVEVIDSAARRYPATLHVEGRRVTATLGEPAPETASANVRIVVAQGVPKGQKMDFVVEKLTELGAASVIPLQCERTVVTDVSSNKVERWRRLAKSAAQQCGRADVPEITEPVHFDRLVQRFAEFDRVLFPWELADRAPLRESLPSAVSGARRILVLVGPEGGFSHAEAEAARAAGAQLISLGTRILRTETAALVVLALLNYVLE